MSLAISGTDSLYSSLLSSSSIYGNAQSTKYYLNIAQKLAALETESEDSSESETVTDSDSDSSDTTDSTSSTEETYTDEENLAFLSYYAGGSTIKEDGMAERAALIRKLTGSTTGSSIDLYA